MAGTKDGAKKFAQKKLAEDPDYFKKLQCKVRKPRGGKHSPGSFKKGNSYGIKGGRIGKRGPGKKRTPLQESEAVTLDNVNVDYIET